MEECQRVEQRVRYVGGYVWFPRSTPSPTTPHILTRQNTYFITSGYVVTTCYALSMRRVMRHVTPRGGKSPIRASFTSQKNTIFLFTHIITHHHAHNHSTHHFTHHIRHTSRLRYENAEQ